jgi:hypothetical protein
MYFPEGLITGRPFSSWGYIMFVTVLLTGQDRLPSPEGANADLAESFLFPFAPGTQARNNGAIRDHILCQIRLFTILGENPRIHAENLLRPFPIIQRAFLRLRQLHSTRRIPPAASADTSRVCSRCFIRRLTRTARRCSETRWHPAVPAKVETRRR